LTEDDRDLLDSAPPALPLPLDDAIWRFAPIMNLKPGECRYIAGEASALAAYCASPTQDGSPWCRTHAQIVLAQP
jgi:hypothetical protein